MTKIENFRFWCQKVLPLVYDDSISYYETLCKFSEKLGEVIEWLDGYEDELRAYVDQKYEALLIQFKADLDAYKITVDAHLLSMQAQLDTVEERVDNKLTALEIYVNKQIEYLAEHVDAQIDALTLKVNQDLAAHTLWVQQQVRDLRNQLSLQIAELALQIGKNLMIAQDYTDLQIELLIRKIPMLQNVIVRCPADGRMRSIQHSLDHMYQIFRDDAMTAWDWRVYGITAGEYDALKLTARQYDLTGIPNWRLGSSSRDIVARPLVHSGFTGLRITYDRAIFEIVQHLREHGLTVDQFKALNLTAGEYDAKKITAYYYDWTGVPV